ncbi:MAG: hypothetical protein SNJ84_04310 [Verrucomicrobiia bacterium]
MPLLPDQLEERLARAADEGRLAHAYLLSGNDLAELEETFFRLAIRLLGGQTAPHPDLHLVKPELKSRRIAIKQIRELESQLYLKAHSAPIKVAGILAADRMCLGQAEAANAFLKTLEEPPPHTVIFLTTNAPELLLPTIRSRCIAVPFQSRGHLANPLPPDWLQTWLQTEKKPTLTAYRRARMLADLWAEQRAQAEQQTKADAAEDEDEDVLKARTEAEFQWRRDLILKALAHGLWANRQPGRESEDGRAIHALEELRYALSRSVDPALATELACLKIEGVLE